MTCLTFPACIKNVFSSPALCPNTKLCFQIKNDPIISCDEKNKVYQVNNPCRWKFAKYRIDKNPIFTESEKKCDYLFVIKDAEEIPHYVFIELKGVDVGTGLAQLKNTIMESKLAKTKHVSARLVARSAPNLSMSKSSSKAVLKWFAENDVNYKAYSRRVLEEAGSLQ